MRRSKTIEKVTAFITKEFKGRRNLLLFKHPLAGIQVPAGTVDLGEKPVQAVLREVEEETQISSYDTVRELDVIDEELPEEERMLLRMSKLFSEPAYDSSSEGFVMTRGSIARVLKYCGDFAFVEAEPMDLRNKPAARNETMNGYVRRSILTREVRRYIFHLETKANCLETWQVQADGHTFDLYWAVLESGLRINPCQQPLLERYYSQIAN